MIRRTGLPSSMLGSCLTLVLAAFMPWAPCAAQERSAFIPRAHGRGTQPCSTSWRAEAPNSSASGPPRAASRVSSDPRVYVRKIEVPE